MDNDLRIVITGIGAVSPVGVGCRATFDSLVAGRSGVGRLTHFDPSRLPSQIAGEVDDFKPSDFMEPKLARRIGRYAQFAIAAAREAMDHAGIDLDREDPTRIACVVASAIGDYPMLERQMDTSFRRGPMRINPFTVPRVSSSMAAGNIALELGLLGPSFGLSSACATGSHSLATAWMMLELGLADVALAGGAESAITETFVGAYAVMRALSTRNDSPEQASRPFDRERDGFVMAEGCGALVLERFEHARARGAAILAELAGVGMSCDAYHMTAQHPDGRGARQAMRAALESAGLAPDDIDYVNAHGTSTLINDPIESCAVKTVFGDDADRVPISSIKSMIGHSIGAAGALEAVTCVMALERGEIPPTINHHEPDPECDLDYVPNEARQAKLSTVMSNSFAFGGQNCVLLFSQPQ